MGLSSNTEVLEVWNQIREKSRKSELPEELIRDFTDLAASERISLLRKVFHGSDKNLGIMLLAYLPQEELFTIFDELIFLSSHGHGALTYIRELIKSLPREWVLVHIEAYADPYLLKGDFETYRCLLGLYYELDKGTTLRLATKAASSTDLDVREAGEDFLEKLKET